MKATFASRRHHWWPEVLSAYWKGSDGKVSQLSPDGRTLRERPESFGVDKHTHNIRVGGPWNSSFEDSFGFADSIMCPLVDRLITLEAKETKSTVLADRLANLTIEEPIVDWLAECLASLVVRSPAMRHRIKVNIECYRGLLGMAGEADTSIVAANMRPMLRSFSDYMKCTGRFAVLFSDEREFIFGDGFLQDFPVRVPVYGKAKCLIPLTPSLAAICCCQSSRPSSSRLATIRLRRNEVEHCNRIVQIYSCDRLFFRRDAPAPTEEFACARYMELQAHSEPWSDRLIDALACL